MTIIFIPKVEGEEEEVEGKEREDRTKLEYGMRNGRR